MIQVDSFSPRLLWRCYRYLRPYWRHTVGAYLFIFLINGLNIIIPQFIRWIVDEGIAAQNTVLLIRAVLGLLALALVRGLFTYWQGLWTEVASQSVALDLRNDIHRKLTELPFAYHDRAESGQLLSRTLQDAERIRFLTGRATLRIVNAVVLFISTVAVLLWMNARLALLLTIILPLIAYIGFRFGRLFRPLSVLIQNQLGILTSRLEQNLRGTMIVKAFAQEPSEIDRFDQENETWFDLSAYAVRLQAVNIPLMDLLANAGMVIVIWYGGVLVIRQAVTLGELVAFTTYLGQLATPVRHLGLLIPAIAMASSAAERIFEIIDTDTEIKDRPDARPLSAIRGEVALENVSYAFVPGYPVLRDISFSARPGEVVALLGATGSGKSTITGLIPRFYDPDAGRVCIDGQDIRQVSLATLRRQIGIVLQETILFAATVRENIAYGRPEASEKEIVAAAKAAQAHEFITTQLPEGYDTHVGEKGTTLSGGQKQRLAIARALLTNPRILILDDATASVDTETERYIQQALHQLMVGRTTFVIAHRLSTVRRADQILLLHKGCIVARGTHESLLRESSRYQEVYYQQLRPEINRTDPVKAGRTRREAAEKEPAPGD